MEIIKKYIKYFKNKNRPKNPVLFEFFSAAVLCFMFSGFFAMLFYTLERTGSSNFKTENTAFFLSFFINSFLVTFTVSAFVILFLFLKKVKEEYGENYQEVFKSIENLPKEKFYLKSFDVEFYGKDSSIKNYEAVVDSPKYIFCIYKKGETKYNFQIDKSTGLESKNTKGLTYYTNEIENILLSIAEDKQKQKINQEKESLKEDANDFFKDVSKLVSKSGNNF